MIEREIDIYGDNEFNTLSDEQREKILTPPVEEEVPQEDLEEFEAEEYSDESESYAASSASDDTDEAGEQRPVMQDDTDLPAASHEQDETEEQL
jgi:hypothetical protein